jgi:hypothetical protein
MEPSRIVVQASGVVVARVTPGGIIVPRFIPHYDNGSHGGVRELEAVFSLNQGSTGLGFLGGVALAEEATKFGEVCFEPFLHVGGGSPEEDDWRRRGLRIVLIKVAVCDSSCLKMVICLSLVFIDTALVMCSGRLCRRSILGARYLEIAGLD